MLEVTLNYLATGNNYRTLSHLSRVSKSAISIMMPIVCETVYDCLKDFVKVFDTHDAWKKVANGFEARCNFPFCCGAIDGKHVLIETPPHTGSEYFNYKGSFSVVLMAIVKIQNGLGKLRSTTVSDSE
ncbi:unnamed protein product [Acanthoscelides obtectus]|uniref:DDE Tnp4 domain-containing protein n=1 Tax=Acanthoscelides obtectus TaxID=200917 RepID=A0A9P0KMC3_ACAOB|nr:unnamed protein product [Acanthoscelides obtectus]CAK1621082.1 hypothetical protein AOBTE_LOCUS753 [Acanthoscelides obtectus]